MPDCRSWVVIALILAVAPAGAQVSWDSLFDDAAPPAKPAPPAPPRPAPPPAAAAPPRAQPAPARVAPRSAAAAPRPAAPAVVKPARPRPAPVAAPAPRAVPPAQPAVIEEHAAEEVVEAAPAAQPEAPAAVVTSAGALPRLADVGLGEGDVISSDDATRFTAILPPGLQWMISQGCQLKVTEAAPMPAMRAYREATEKYAGQVRLGPGGLSIENYVAGQPFPHIDPNDPDAVMRIMWNYYYNYNVTDDISMRNFEPRTGTVSEDGSLRIERAFIVDAYRKLNYNGRLYVEPRPELPNDQGVRFKESVHPIIEPFDLKGVGFTAYRYLDPAKQDDSWIYLPQLRRVRRLSSAQRSDALFGQDTDADAFGGYNGHIAWMDYTLLGQQTVLAPMHARNSPAVWAKPHDFMFDDVWEPRRVWVIEARSRSPQYAYGKRVLYVDSEAYLIPLSDSYDRAGQLWKVQINMYAFKKEGSPGDTIARYDEDRIFQHATVIMDAQLQHATASAVPSTKAKANGSYVLDMGARSGATEDYFTVAHLIATGR